MQIMNDREDGVYYKDLANKVQEVIKLEDTVTKWSDEDFLQCDTFKYFDEKIINKLVDVLISGAAEFEKYRSIINRRKSLNW